VIGHEADQRKHEEAVRKAADSTREWTLHMIERYREQERELRDMRARVGDLVIARCWPYPDMYRACYVTRVDGRGWPTHLRDGKGIRYGPKARTMPEQCLIVPREKLSVPPRDIAVEHRDAHFCGVDLQAIVGRIVAGYYDSEAQTDPVRYADPSEAV
jgi:hypothetical protein